MENYPKAAALITGGATRIGKAFALALAHAGYDIALHYNTSAEAAIHVRQEIKSLGVDCDIFQADLSNTSDVKNLFVQVQDRFSTLSLLINSASIFEPGTLDDTTEDLFDRHISVNMKAPFFLTQTFAKTVEAGHIINITDAMHTHLLASHLIYSLTKKSLTDFTLLMAADLAPKIRVNAIAPGWILPPSSDLFGDRDAIRKTVPLQTQGSLDDMTRALLFLVNNSYVTGQILYIDGGRHL